MRIEDIGTLKFKPAEPQTKQLAYCTNSNQPTGLRDGNGEDAATSTKNGVGTMDNRMNSPGWICRLLVNWLVVSRGLEPWTGTLLSL